MEDEISERASLQANGQSLLNYDQIPLWQQENEYILTGYRLTSSSLLHSILTVFNVHNESVSIHTHLLTSIFFVYLPTWLKRRFSSSLDEGDIAVLTVSLVSISACFFLSSCCHIFWNHSPAWAAKGNQLDYLGIVVLIWGTSIALIYYGFYCEPSLQRFYWLMTSTTALITANLTVHSLFASPIFRPYRALMYISLGLTALIFTSHGIWIHGWEMQSKLMSFKWMGVVIVCNILGAGFYVSRIPERWFPYTFDILGGSHQIFHVMVIGAGLAFLGAACEIVEHIHQHDNHEVGGGVCHYLLEA